MFRNLIFVTLFICVSLIICTTLVFGQCGADGLQPCSPADKKTPVKTIKKNKPNGDFKTNMPEKSSAEAGLKSKSTVAATRPSETILFKKR